MPETLFPALDVIVAERVYAQQVDVGGDGGARGQAGPKLLKKDKDGRTLFSHIPLSAKKIETETFNFFLKKSIFLFHFFTVHVKV